MSACVLDPIAGHVLEAISPSGTLAAIVAANAELDTVLDHFDSAEAALAHLGEKSTLDRLEDDFAKCVPSIADAAVPIESWAIPLLSAFAGPAAPLLSFGLQVACKVAIAALQAWAKKRLAGA